APGAVALPRPAAFRCSCLRGERVSARREKQAGRQPPQYPLRSGGFSRRAKKTPAKARSCLINGFGGDGRVSSGAKARSLRVLEVGAEAPTPREAFMRRPVASFTPR